MALLLLSLLSLAQSEVVAATAAASGGTSISTARQDNTAALLRVTGKTQAFEIRAGRPPQAKFVSGNPGVLAPAAAFLLVARAAPVQAVVASATLPAPELSTNQPRAPPFR